jgi:putative Mg2+ transporter-C (MgtC) family protein
MDRELLVTIAHLVAALAAGGVIGLERSFHGRPAGFRTHSLVCLASSLLMLVTTSQGSWMPGIGHEAIRTDPTRMAQGIMTGIGFLGAGVIFKEGLSVRGLTTAASIWITAAIGILVGVGLYVPATIATLLTLAVLSAFRWVEARLPSHFYAHYLVRFGRNEAMSEAAVRQLLAEHHFSVANVSHRLSDDGRYIEYRMIIRTRSPGNVSSLSTSMRSLPSVHSFRISPTGD